ncbi:hypothetical protein E4T47_01201 [Aureobasidium subglaciale]|nr:hypothetical protein E4T47_01201 [Aureobasidium subglaciale]
MLHTKINETVQDLYDSLCVSHGITPTVAEIQHVKDVILSIGHSRHNKIEPALLFFIPRSALGFVQDTLLIGWIEAPGCPRAEAWYKFSGKSNIYAKPGAPRDSLYTNLDPLCDIWCQALDDVLVLDEIEERAVQYAYFAAVVAILRADPPPPSFEDHPASDTAARHLTSPTEDRRSSLLDTPRSPRKKRRLVKREEAYPIIDLTESDTGEAVTFEPDLAPKSRQHPFQIANQINRDVESSAYDGEDQSLTSQVEPDMSVKIAQEEQELRQRLQSKEVTEIESMLASNSGQLPKWIESLAKEEVQKKKLHDLAMAKDWFR